MDILNLREQELVAIGAAIGSNCVPCIEYHVPLARSAGLTDTEIGEAIRLADKLKQVPADNVRKTGMQLVTDQQPATAAGGCTGDVCGCRP